MNSCSHFSIQQEGEAADETDLRIMVWLNRILGMPAPFMIAPIPYTTPAVSLSTIVDLQYIIGGYFR